MQLASLLQKRRRKKGDEEKGVGKAGSQESGDRREEEENLAREQVRQCSCSLVLCVFVSCVDVLSTSALRMHVLCVFVDIFRVSCMYVGMCVCVYSRSTRR